MKECLSRHCASPSIVSLIIIAQVMYWTLTESELKVKIEILKLIFQKSTF